MTALAQTADLSRPADAAASTRVEAPASDIAHSWLHGSALRRVALAVLCAAGLWTSVAWALVRGS